MAHVILTAATSARGRPFFNVQISHPFGKQELLRIFTEIECSCESSYSELHNDPLERQYCHIRTEYEEDRQVTSEIREMHREKESWCCSFAVLSRSSWCASDVTKRLHILQLLDVFGCILIFFSVWACLSAWYNGFVLVRVLLNMVQKIQNKSVQKMLNHIGIIDQRIWKFHYCLI
jgi:hypothetical protein